MKRNAISYIIVLIFAVATIAGCRHGNNRIQSEADSIAYAVGMSVGHNLMEVDSTLNIDMVCRAIRDVWNDNAKMTNEEARLYLLAQHTYFVHEKALAYQEQFLADLNRSDRSYVRTRTGVTYKIHELGNQSVQTMSARDTIRMVRTLCKAPNDTILVADTVRLAYRELPNGLQEIVRIAGDGGIFDAWLPSKTAYDTEGNEELGIGPDCMLHYDVEILSIDYFNIAGRRK